MLWPVVFSADCVARTLLCARKLEPAGVREAVGDAHTGGSRRSGDEALVPGCSLQCTVARGESKWPILSSALACAPLLKPPPLSCGRGGRFDSRGLMDELAGEFCRRVGEAAAVERRALCTPRGPAGGLC
eukprot:scaffold20013_cov31-Tisochrysis_lutea.AAC.4